MACILVLDGEPARQQFYPNALSGHTIVPSAHPMIASKKTHTHHPDLVLACWTEGLILLEEYRRLRGFHAPPVVLMDEVKTNAQLLAMSERAKTYGASGFLPLPIVRDRFRLFVETALFHARHGSPVALWITKVSPAPDAADRFLNLIITGDAYERIADAMGGWDVLDRILEKWQIRRNPTHWKDVRFALFVWGSLRSEDQLLRAVTIITTLANQDRDPVGEVLWEVAQAICFGVPGLAQLVG
jgi:hypothetical protein